MNQKFNKLSEIADRVWIAFGVIGFFTVLLPDCRKQMGQYHPAAHYTQEEQEIIDRYLEDQHQFDYDYGTSKADRM